MDISHCTFAWIRYVFIRYGISSDKQNWTNYENEFSKGFTDRTVDRPKLKTRTELAVRGSLNSVLSCQNEACTVHEWNEKKILKGMGSSDVDSPYDRCTLLTAGCNCLQMSGVVEP